MANKSLFQSIVGKLLPRTDAINEEFAPAYRFSDKHALAQFAATGCLNSTFYATDAEQLDKVLALCQKVEPEFIARTALYARQSGYMKDLPALLVAVLSVKGPGLMAEVFDRVIDSPKMLRNFVQIMRSGAVGRKSLGTLPKRLVEQWLETRTDEQVFNGSVGQAPSMADVIRMVHPKPATASRQALYAYLIGREYGVGNLPEIVQQFEQYKKADDRAGQAVPDVPFQMLTALDLGRQEWTQIARNASWQMTRMNLNTFLRHGVFEVAGMAEIIAARLADPKLVEKVKVFPYQLMVAYMSTSRDLPGIVREALQDAMEISIRNVPAEAGKVYVFPDVSGSMQTPVTGHRKGSTTAVRCVDVAALVAAAVLRRNPTAEVIPFSTDVVPVELNPRDSVLTNAQRLASLPAGGTNCSAPLALLNAKKARGDLVIYVSDNESWVDSRLHGVHGGSATATMREWAAFKARSPQARMVCIDIQPYDTTQAKERSDIINVAGFSDQVFDLIGQVAAGAAGADHWVRQIEAVTL
jgi:60 kDa SS-A/Ro ribonucleoprotein